MRKRRGKKQCSLTGAVAPGEAQQHQQSFHWRRQDSACCSSSLCSSSSPSCRCSWFLFFVSALDNSSRSEDTWTSPFNRSFPSLLLVCFYLLRRLSVLLRLCFHFWVQSSHLLHHWQTSSCGRRI